MSSAAARIDTTDDAPLLRRAGPFLTVTPSERTIQATTAADRLRGFIDEMCLAYRLTPAERSLILTAELARAARNDLAWERSAGNTSPLCLRFIKPACDDAAVAEAEAVADGMANDSGNG